MADRQATFTFASQDDTARFAEALGAQLRPGDTILLEGDIGAGKTFLARALIQSLQDQAEDVPSPTFTLVQTYETSVGEIWHSDLYRIHSSDEIEELGLIDAFDTSICLIEWPDRLGDLTPTNALKIALRTDKTDLHCRHAQLEWRATRWDDRIPHMHREATQ